MLKLTACLVAGVSILAIPCRQTPPSAPAADLAALAWLAGEWRGKVGDTDVVEWHSDPDGGVIVMASKELTGGKVNLFDFGVVSAKDGKISFVPYPNGKSSVAFALTGFDPKVERATFENLDHDFPKRFVYERKSPNVLQIVLTGDEQGKPATVEYELKRANHW